MVRYLIIENLLSSFIRYKTKDTNSYKSVYLYSAKPLPDKSFCLNNCRCGGKFDLVIFIPCLILGLCLSECHLDFINVLGI